MRLFNNALKINNLFFTLEQCEHLSELGFNMDDACFVWRRRIHGSDIDDESTSDWRIDSNDNIITYGTYGFTNYETVPVYTLEESLKKLPEIIKTNKHTYYFTSDKKNIWYQTIENTDILYKTECKSLRESIYNIICYLLENNFIKNLK